MGRDLARENPAGRAESINGTNCGHHKILYRDFLMPSRYPESELPNLSSALQIGAARGEDCACRASVAGLRYNKDSSNRDPEEKHVD
jgi:hypothetical protein